MNNRQIIRKFLLRFSPQINYLRGFSRPKQFCIFVAIFTQFLLFFYFTDAKKVINTYVVANTTIIKAIINKNVIGNTEVFISSNFEAVDPTAA